MPRPSLVIVLVEDSRHEQLVRAYLKRLGLGPHDIRIRKSHPSVGSAEQWVRKNFPIEVQACRRRPAKTILIVMIDADLHSVQQRLDHLDTALQQAGVPQHVRDEEMIVRLVPKRNVETWILYVNGSFVDEQSDFKHHGHDWNEMIRTGAHVLYDWTRPNAVLPPTCIDSLQVGVRELRKLSFS